MSNAEDSSDDYDFCVALTSDGLIDGSAGACATSFAVYDGLVALRRPGVLQALQNDALWLAWPLARGSFWWPSGTAACNPLEELAARIFRFHTAGSTVPIDPAISGAEFWCNITRSEQVTARRGYGNITFHVIPDIRPCRNPTNVTYTRLAPCRLTRTSARTARWASSSTRCSRPSPI